MFTHPLPISKELFSVQYADYAITHFLKNFEKKYPGKQWEFTDLSIKQDLARLRMENNTTQKSDQIDELKHHDVYWLAKYDFKIAKTKVSTKASGNRCLLFIDQNKDRIEILLIYHKDDIPKKKKETHYLMDVMREQYNGYEKLFDIHR